MFRGDIFEDDIESDTGSDEEGSFTSNDPWFFIDESNLEKYEGNLYEEDMVHFKKDITGEVVDYYLTIPNI